MANEIVFTEKEKALICVSASIAAGCRPCTEYHVNGARRAGACDRSIALAIETAVTVRENATRNMESWGERCAGPRPEIEQEFRNGKRFVTELAAVAAAAAVNSVPDLLARIEAAKLAGATQQQIVAALAVAASIRGTAVKKVEAAVGGVVGKASPCCESGRPEVQDIGDGNATACGCGR
jgi:AhpD family alkylhydroperoxidase